MLIGFYMCIILVPCFAVLALVFAVFKEKSVKLISGFNTLPKWKQENMTGKGWQRTIGIILRFGLLLC